MTRTRHGTDAAAYARVAKAESIADDRALAIVREHERMRVVLLAIADACRRAKYGALRRAVGDLAALGMTVR